ncbi:MAG: CHAD domain-containing protein [Calothrix sp. C42_A2020_038]|nr:CHAD domain-containing protein [Calothrix sp. C42_A2020_038]
MTLAAKPVVRTLGDYAYQAIQKHFKKTLKWEKTVKKDEDPEALHQMRVGMRRLRTVVTRFEFVVNLPKAVTNRNIGKIARRLGNLRDLDVLKETVEKFQPPLPPQEQKHLQTVFDAIDKQRAQAVTDVKATLKDSRYKSLKTSLDHWLEEPSYHEMAPLQIDLALPDLLLPEVSYFLLHPGWQFGMPVVTNNSAALSMTSLLRSYPKGMTNTQVEQNLAGNHEVLHSLRKQAKRLRYQMELFADFYAESYGDYLNEIKNIQDVLGEIHDSDVLEDWLVDVFGENFTEKLPTFTSLIVDKRHQLWQQWAPIQRRYTQAETRNQLHLAILNPVSLQVEDN